MKHGEAAARKAAEDARQAVIKACTDLLEAEMFLDAFKSHEHSVVGGAAARAASAGDIANTHASNLRESVVGGAAAEYLAREGQQARESRLPSISEVIVDRHTTNLHAGDEVGENFNCLPECIEFRADSEPVISVNIAVAQRDFELVLLALQSLLDVVESSAKGGAGGHGCHSSSSVRRGCRTIPCGVCGAPNLTEGEPPSGRISCDEELVNRHPIDIEMRLKRTLDGAEGGRGLSGASAHTPAGHTVQVSKYKIFARPEVGVRRG